MNASDFKSLYNTIPHLPGVYQYIGDDDEILYIGKAKNLAHRLSSYFHESNNHSVKTKRMLHAARQIIFTIVETEQDAFLLENTLIKKHQPRFNIMLKDDKTYPFIVIKYERFPRVEITRLPNKKEGEIIGPFTSVVKVRTVLDLVRKLFTIRTCNLNLSKENINKGKYKACLEYHIGNCKAPCENFQSEEEYFLQIQNIRNILKGNFGSVVQYLKEKIAEHSTKYEFERAQELKEKLNYLLQYQNKSTVVNPAINDVDVFSIAVDETKAFVNYMKIMNGSIIQSATIEVTKNATDDIQELFAQTIHQIRERYDSSSNEIILPFELDLYNDALKLTVPKLGGKKKLLELSLKNAEYHKRINNQDDETKLDAKTRVLLDLQKALNLPQLPLHIECFDNSNLQGSNPVSSCVVFKKGKPAKSEYRHYNVKTVDGPNDFATMEEVVTRRYTRLLDEEKPLPDLIVIDGGKGQLGMAVQVLIQLHLIEKIPIVGLAKRMEEVFVPGDELPIYINKKSESLKLLQHIRDEAHHFAVSFHRKKRSSNFIKTELHDIKGLGTKTIELLLAKYKSVKNIRTLHNSELEQTIGKSRAKILVDYFNEN